MPKNAPLTSAQRQARRREQFRRYREALEAVLEARSLKEAKSLAGEALKS
jgi:predicted N-formylglutamate amidohydrolase